MTGLTEKIKAEIIKKWIAGNTLKELCNEYHHAKMTIWLIVNKTKETNVVRKKRYKVCKMSNGLRCAIPENIGLNLGDKYIAEGRVGGVFLRKVEK